MMMDLSADLIRYRSIVVSSPAIDTNKSAENQRYLSIAADNLCQRNN
jgi:hypothetical protein